jgi:hypothetical protein
MPLILDTQEAEIRAGSNQLRQIVLETLSQNYPTHKGLAEWLKW